MGPTKRKPGAALRVMPIFNLQDVFLKGEQKERAAPAKQGYLLLESSKFLLQSVFLISFNIQ
jgi:hypothetical protein